MGRLAIPAKGMGRFPLQAGGVFDEPENQAHLRSRNWRDQIEAISPRNFAEMKSLLWRVDPLQIAKVRFAIYLRYGKLAHDHSQISLNLRPGGYAHIFYPCC